MESFWAIINENFFPGRPRFTAADVPDMTGKVVLVTGGTAGIGKETARVSVTSIVPVLAMAVLQTCLTHFSGVANQERQSLDHCP